ncbi:MAG: peroxiredoxin [Thermoplasmatota archaeon]
MDNLKLEEGKKAPDFTLKDHKGNDFRLYEHLREKPVVLYFYPKDGTTGCTAQACAFRDHYQDFMDEGAEVVGVSSDSEKRHTWFIDRHSLPFTLLSDADGGVRKLYGVPRTMGLLPGRVTYVIDMEGVIRYIFNSQTKISEHVERSLEIIRRIGK